MTNTNGAERERHERIVPFTTEDGMDLNLINVRGDREPTREPVILVHGAGVRGNIFRAPVDTTVVDALIDNGFDVWLENWRASIDFPPNHWTLDQAAHYDHPAAVKTVVRESGHDRVKAIIHCQGSTSFAMSACAGLIPEVDTIISNAVSLHTIVPAWSRLKMNFALPAVRKVMDYLDPAWGDHAPDTQGKLITLAVKLAHHECNNTVCKLVSFTYGSGNPALWRHENLNEATHNEFIPQEFGHVPMTFFQQMARCVSAGHLVSYEKFNDLPADYTAKAPATDARFVFFAGQQNQCFLPDSQRETFEFLSGFRRNYHALHVLPTYSHLDVFLGKSAAHDVFPLMVEELQHPVAA